MAINWIKIFSATMLQKLSKCEVKAARSENFAMCLSLRFYVKFWQIQMVKKCHFWLFYRFWISIFSKFEPFLKSQIYQNSKFGVSEIGKWQCLTFKFCQNWFQAKLSGKSMLVLWTLTSHFESFWSIVQCYQLILQRKFRNWFPA